MSSQAFLPPPSLISPTRRRPRAPPHICPSCRAPKKRHNPAANPRSNSRQTTTSRRAFLGFLPLSVLAAATTANFKLHASSYSPPYDDLNPPSAADQSPKTPYEPPIEFGWEHRFEELDVSPATIEDYYRVQKVPPTDIPELLRSYIRLAGLISLPVITATSITALSYRTSSRITIPATYDVIALQRYFSVRPDVLFRRMAQFAREAVGLLSGLAMDRLAAAVDETSVRLGAHKPAWLRPRTYERSQRRAIALRDALTRLGPAMIKLGQTAASRPDLLPTSVIRELQPLQDDVLASFPTEEAFAVIREELNASVDAIFDSVDPVPVAGASLGMVFKGSIDGTEVAVKVQRPEVAESVALDCYIVRTFAMVATTLFGLRTDWRAAVDEYASRLFEELDYTIELSNMTRFRAAYQHVDGIYIPRAFPEYCSRRVLVTEWIEGEKLIDERAKVRAEDLTLVETGIEFALTQLLEGGLLHAVLRTKFGLLAYIDFGLVSEVPQSVRESIVCALMYLIHRDYEMLAECFAGLEIMRADDVEIELPKLTEALREAFEPTEDESLVENGESGEGNERKKELHLNSFTLVGMAGKLLMLGSRFPFIFKDYFLSNLRCLGMLEGLAVNADPKFEMLNVVYPYIVRKILQESRPAYQETLEAIVLDKYGRVRWDRIDQLLLDLQSAATTVEVRPRRVRTTQLRRRLRVVPKRVLRAAVWSRSRKPDGETKDGKGLTSRSSSTVVLRFMTSKSGRFVRGYVMRQMLLNLELTWRKRVDKLLGLAPATNVRLVNAHSAYGYDAAMRRVERADSDGESMSDDEAQTRAGEFFRHTPLTQKCRVLVRLAPGMVLPFLRTLAGIAVYLVWRLVEWLLSRRPQARGAPRKPLGNGREGRA